MNYSADVLFASAYRCASIGRRIFRFGAVAPFAWVEIRPTVWANIVVHG